VSSTFYSGRDASQSQHPTPGWNKSVVGTLRATRLSSLCPIATTSVHLLPPVAIHSVAFSGKPFFIPDSFGAFIKASLEIHALITSPSYRFGIAMCSMVLQK